MSVKIRNVKRFSKCAVSGVCAGDELISVDGNEIMDVLDYDFYMMGDKVTLEILHKGKVKTVKTTKEKCGLEFETYLMDAQQGCRNKCIFCFIDQLPKGMRKTLYFKDDDSRLSFLFGNYITLTNISEHEIERIIKMHISPVNISVHTMNPQLRVKMMKNPHAGESLQIIKRFADAGIKMNTQLVLCPGYNDGDELLYSLTELSKMYPSVVSIAAVPVGLTKYRDGLPELTPFTPETASNVIDIMEHFGDEFKKKHGTRLCFPADEFYLKSGRPLPPDDFYEDYPQIENGVGMWTSFKTEFLDYFDNFDKSLCPETPKTVSIATGMAAFPLMQEFAEKLQETISEIKVNVYGIRNEFFGESITVTGLITGKDLINQLKNKELGSTLLISSNMIIGSYQEESENIFLDDVTLTQAKEELNVNIIPVTENVSETVQKILEVE